MTGLRKGNCGILLAVFAVLAYVLCFFELTQLLFLLLGFVLIAEKDAWLSKKVITATSVRLVAILLGAIVTWVSNPFISLFSEWGLYAVSDVFSGILSTVTGVINFVVLVFCVIEIIFICRGKELKIPGWTKLLDKMVPSESDED